jgi:hypothetical protein
MGRNLITTSHATRNSLLDTSSKSDLIFFSNGEMFSTYVYKHGKQDPTPTNGPIMFDNQRQPIV